MHRQSLLTRTPWFIPGVENSFDKVFGGILTSAFNWRATFWFLVIFACIALVSFVFLLKDTWRPERSLAYQNAVQRIEEAKMKEKLNQTSIELKNIHERPRKKGEGKHKPQKNDDINGVESQAEKKKHVVLSIKDLNVLGASYQVIKRKNNLLTLTASGKHKHSSPQVIHRE
jgi:hypothetical protein